MVQLLANAHSWYHKHALLLLHTWQWGTCWGSLGEFLFSEENLYLVLVNFLYLPWSCKILMSWFAFDEHPGPWPDHYVTTLPQQFSRNFRDPITLESGMPEWPGKQLPASTPSSRCRLSASVTVGHEVTLPRTAVWGRGPLQCIPPSGSLSCTWSFQMVRSGPFLWIAEDLNFFLNCANLFIVTRTSSALSLSTGFNWLIPQASPDYIFHISLH